MARLSNLRRFWGPFRALLGLALLGLAVWVLSGKWSELSGAGAFLARPHWGWLLLAAVAELASFLSLAALEQTLMTAGEVRRPLRRFAAVTFAGNSVQSALPVGAAFAGLYIFRQYQFLGADDVLAGWVVVATSAVAFSAIAGLAGVALALAASTGTTFDLFEAIAGVLAVALVAVLAWAYRARLYPWVIKVVAAVERATRRPPGQLSGPMRHALDRMRTVAPSRGAWARAWSAGIVDWVADCSCLGFAFLAVGAGVPWRGLLLAYCGGQLATLLPITPGGLGVVEGSMTVALVAFGGGKVTTVAAVLLYRLFSFWVPLPLGALCYLVLAREHRRNLRRQAAAAAPGNVGMPAAPAAQRDAPKAQAKAIAEDR